MRVRNRRTWRRFYRPGRQLVWHRSIVFNDVSYRAGDPIPDHLYADKGWCRRRWISRLLDFREDFPYSKDDPRRPGYVPPEPVLPDPPVLEGGDPEAETGDGDGAEVDDPEPEGGDLTIDSPPVLSDGATVNPDPPAGDEAEVG